MISIIINVPDSENSIDNCISSILDQTYVNFEIITVVHSSDENSLKLLKNLNNDKIKIIVNNVLKKEYISKNLGLKYAEGDYILFLNSNYTLNKNALEILTNKSKKYQTDIVFTNINLNNKSEEIKPKQINIEKDLNDDEICKNLVLDNLSNQYTLFFKKEFLIDNNIKFEDETYFMNEELFILNCIISTKKLCFINTILINEHFIGTKSDKNKLNITPFSKVINNFLERKHDLESLKLKFWNYLFKKIFELIYELRDEGTKREYFKDAKLLFDECCYTKGNYNDIHNSLDIIVWEFFNQTLDDVYYNPKKRETLRRLVNENFGPLTIAIKSPNPVDDQTWGDYFFAKSLKKSFEKRGFKVVIHELENWYSKNDNENIVIVLRGLSKYNPQPEHINVIWNISHPEVISIEEYEYYDLVFISSEKYSKIIDEKADVPVKPLLQCTDPDIFHPEFNENYVEDILFVGRTRKVFRQIIKDLSTTKHDFSVYGEGWDNFIDKKFIKGEFIQNNILNQYYSSCKILLNDHWEDMKELDFPSNRLFDALACGAFIISDNINSAKTIFENNVVTYTNSEDLNKKIDFYLKNADERNKKRQSGRRLVLTKHTFDNRANEIIENLKNLNF